MAKIIFLSIPGHGHVNPTLAVVRELVRRGDEVIYYNTPEFREKIERSGASFRPYPEPNISAEELGELVGALVNVTLFLLAESERLLPFTLDELRREEPDVVVFDSICLWGMQAAHLLRLPSVSSISTFVAEGVSGLLRWRDALHLARYALPALPRLLVRRRRLIKRYGPEVFPYRHLFPCIGDENVVYTSREFQPETDFVDASFHFVGPSLDAAARGPAAMSAADDFPWELVGERRPLVYLAQGTVHASVAFVGAAYAAFGDHPGQFVLAAGRAAGGATVEQPPANFIVRPFVPQLALLQHVDLFVSHGGMNSINEGLYEGVPLVVVPQQLEQLFNGRRVAALGAGVVIGDRPPYGRVRPSELRAAAERVLAD
ncbi:MAG: glycosyltransferase, partial [Candidatus Promineifilaceae bacterium]|nr:glycosyltransferase [Candidatus Promineifilaceae bacterium]